MELVEENHQNFIDRTPTYHMKSLPERYNQVFLRKTEMTRQKRQKVMNKLS